MPHSRVESRNTGSLHEDRAMTRLPFAALLLLVPLVADAGAQPPKASDIDFNKAKQLLDKEKKGEKLTADEQSYLDKAKEEYRKRQAGGSEPAKGGKEKTGLVPLTDLGSGK